jgi:hypothetical protein
MLTLALILAPGLAARCDLGHSNRRRRADAFACCDLEERWYAGAAASRLSPTQDMLATH